MAKTDAVSTAPFVRSPYNYDTMAASDESGLKCEDPSLTQQSAKDDCDINVILSRMARGVEPPLSDRQPVFADVTASPDSYHEAMNIVIAAQEAFGSLDAKVRARFDNDPAQVLAFLDDDANRDEAIKLGLIPQPESSSEDLSTPPPAAIKGGKAGGGVEKSEQPRKGMFGRSTPIPKGYKLVPEGGEGDE